MSLSEESKQRFRQMLLDMRRELLDQVKAETQRTRVKDYLGDLTDWATTDMIADYGYMLCDRLRERIWLIDEALDAIDSGDYGLCEECEEPINEKRLLLMPFTRFCVGCQSKLERQAKMRGNSLPEFTLSVSNKKMSLDEDDLTPVKNRIEIT